MIFVRSDFIFSLSLFCCLVQLLNPIRICAASGSFSQAKFQDEKGKAFSGGNRRLEVTAAFTQDSASFEENRIVARSFSSRLLAGLFELIQLWLPRSRIVEAAGFRVELYEALEGFFETRFACG